MVYAIRYQQELFKIPDLQYSQLQYYNHEDLLCGEYGV